MYNEPGVVELPEDFFRNNITWERRSVDCRTVHAREDSIRAIARMGEVRIESYSFSRDLIEQTDQ
jgi:hypothetical protein